MSLCQIPNIIMLADIINQIHLLNYLIGLININSLIRVLSYQGY